MINISLINNADITCLIYPFLINKKSKNVPFYEPVKSFVSFFDD
jgi:hypothetical protein